MTASVLNVSSSLLVESSLMLVGTCDGCGARQVMGTSEALLRGHIDFKEDL